MLRYQTIIHIDGNPESTFHMFFNKFCYFRLYLTAACLTKLLTIIACFPIGNSDSLKTFIEGNYRGLFQCMLSHVTVYLVHGLDRLQPDTRMQQKKIRGSVRKRGPTAQVPLEMTKSLSGSHLYLSAKYPM
jgi:hypothetical protein